MSVWHPQILFILFFLKLSSSHLFGPNNSYEGLALFNQNQTMISLEDGLDEWHEQNVRYYVDPRYRILTVSSLFNKKDLEEGGFVFYAFSNFRLIF